jgi:hypothetical protein
VSELEHWLAARAITRAQLEAQPDVSVARDVSYERLDGVDRLRAPDFAPGLFFFERDALRLVYLGDEELHDPSADALAAELGEPDQVLRSRAGAGSRMELHAGRGLAFSREGDHVDFVEVFEPTTVDRYLAEIYEDPGAFIR